MNRKIRVLYLLTFIVITGFLIVIILHMLFQKKEQKQQYAESKLPSENYLPDAEHPIIRVVLKTGSFLGITHSEVKVSAAGGLRVYSGETVREYRAGEELCVKPDHEMFAQGTIWIEPKNETDKITISSYERGCGVPSYRGKMELFSTAEGIVIVNELPVDEYLCGVVPSEMPSSYEKEALKCQAVCARSYAYCQMQSFAYPEYSAHVDDSTSYQVYGNSGEQETTNEAVNDTRGQKVWFQNQVVKTYYYSTSCGKSTSVEAWGTSLGKHNQYLCGVDVCNEEGVAYEKELPWYKWKAVIPEKCLSNLIELNTEKEIGTLRNIKVTKIGAGGCVLQIVAEGSEGSVTVETENKIRTALGGSGYKIEKQDGTKQDSTRLLPSAFFSIAKNDGSYIIEGGGYGHGIGMSQNGANEMAKTGKTYEEILMFFYPGTKVE